MHVHKLSSICTASVSLLPGLTATEVLQLLFAMSQLCCARNSSSQQGLLCRTGSVLVNGTIGSATVMSSGTGSVFLLGTNNSVAVDLAGVSNVYLRNANGRLLQIVEKHSIDLCSWAWHCVLLQMPRCLHTGISTTQSCLCMHYLWHMAHALKPTKSSPPAGKCSLLCR